MDVATFGGACSPSIAKYLKNQNAKERAEQFSNAAKAIIENHYVNYLDSTDPIEEAVQLIQEVKHVHALSEMEYRNSSSNSAEVPERVGELNKNHLKSQRPDSGKDKSDTVKRVTSSSSWCPSSR